MFRSIKIILFAIFLSVNVSILSAQVQGQKKIDSLQNLLEVYIQDDTIKVSYIIGIASETEGNNLEKSFEYSKKALAISEKINFKKGIAQANRLIGKYYNRKLDLSKSLEYFNTALKISDEIDDKLIQSRILIDIGMCYYLKEAYSTALEYNFKAIKLLDSMRTRNTIASCYSNIAQIYFKLNDDKALEFMQKALDIYTSLNDSAAIERSLSSIGNLYFSKNKNKEALDYLSRYLNIVIKNNDRINMAKTYCNIGNVYENLKQYKNALEYFKNALDISEELSYNLGILYNTANIGIIYNEIAKTSISKYPINKNNAFISRAINYLVKSETIAKEMDARIILRDVDSILSNIYSSLGDWQKAYAYQESFYATNDSINTFEKAQLLSKMNKKIEGTIKQKEIELLNSENSSKQILLNIFIISLITIIILIIIFFIIYRKKRNKLFVIKKQSEELEINNNEFKSKKIQIENSITTMSELIPKLNNQKIEMIANNKNKDNFLSLIARDLKKPIESIKFSLHLLLDKANALENNSQTDEFINFYNNSSASRLKIENLICWAEILSNRINFQPRINSLNEIIFNSLEYIKPLAISKNTLIKFNPENDIKVLCEPKFILSIISNLLSNSIIHNNDGTEINITKKIIIINDSKFVQISVRDNGRGISKDKIENLFNINSDEMDESSGLDLSLCFKLVKLHKGDINIESKLAAGSNFIINLPWSNDL